MVVKYMSGRCTTYMYIRVLAMTIHASKLLAGPREQQSLALLGNSKLTVQTEFEGYNFSFTCIKVGSKTKICRQHFHSQSSSNIYIAEHRPRKIRTSNLRTTGYVVV